MGQALLALARSCDKCLGFHHHHTVQEEVEALREHAQQLGGCRMWKHARFWALGKGGQLPSDRMEVDHQFPAVPAFSFCLARPLRVAGFDRRRAAFVPGWPRGRPC